MPYAVTQINRLHEERVRIGAEIRQRFDAAANDNKRRLTDEENAKVDQLIAEGEKVLAEIKRMERASGIVDEATVAARAAAATDPNASPADRAEPEKADEDAERRTAGKGFRDTPEYRALFRQYISAGGQLEALDIARQAMKLRAQHRDLQSDNFEQAGALVPPEQFVLELIKALDDAVYVRQWARKFSVRQARSLGAPKRTSKLSTWQWGAELATPVKDVALKFGKRNLFPQHASGLVLVSNDFLAAAVMEPERMVLEEMARDGGELQENGFLTGDGNNQPLGVYTASPEGISTGRDVVCGTTTEPTLDGLIDAKFSIKEAYWPRLRMLGSRTFKKHLYAMRDGEGRPILVDGYKVGGVDRALDIPVTSSEFNPATFTTGQYVAIIGDWSTYWIADALDASIQRLNELYALTNQVGYISRLKVDGMPVLEEAWARLKLA